MSTSAGGAAIRTVRPFAFEGLPSFGRSEIALWNWSARFFRDAEAWKSWIQQAWGDLLLAPAGLEVTLAQSNSVEPQATARTYSFKQKEVLIGRDPASDVVLDTLAAGKRHARLIVDRGRCFLEDLGSSLGTYCNQVRVPANQRNVLERGDQISIFPYVFTVAMRQVWARQADIGVYPGHADSMTWQAFQDSAARGRSNFAIRIHPTGARLHVEISQAFLAELADRVLRPLDLSASSPAGGATEQALVEFLVLCLAGTVSRDLAFPFQLELLAGHNGRAIGPHERGVSIASSVSLLATTGALRVFVPYSSLESMRPVVPDREGPTSESITWRFPLSLGSIDLTSSELTGLERQDVLIPTRRLELLLPDRFDRGWAVRSLDPSGETSTGPRNIGRLQIENYFEREPLNPQDVPAESPPEMSKSPELGQLPVRVHVILAEKELTLSEASHLTKGSILELDQDPAAPVTLAVNGKALGDGQLVDVEGRLGVRILSWRGA